MFVSRLARPADFGQEKAGFVQRLVARFSVLKVTEPRATRGGVLFQVRDHKLDIYG
jgi:hypothetical protein